MLKKIGIIGIGITILVLSIVVGIASLPDEVLLESSTNENSQILSEDTLTIPTIDQVSNFVQEDTSEKKIEKTNAELNVLRAELNKLKKELNQIKSVSEIPEDLSEVSKIEYEQLENQTEGRIISVKLNSGVGGAER